MLAVVLAAGRGKRLRPLTDVRSKAMLPVAGKPMVERVIDMLERGGADRFLVVAHPDDSLLLNHLTRPRWRGRVRFAYQYRRRGMADALQRAAPLINEEGVPDFILSACDNLFPDGYAGDLVARRRATDLDAAISLMQVNPEQVTTLAVVVLRDDLVTEIVEKPRPEDAPSDLGVPALYALSLRVLEYLPRVPVSTRGEKEFPDALRLLINDGGRVGGLLVRDRMTMTSPGDLLVLNRYALVHDPACAIVETSSPGLSCVCPPVRIEEGVEIGPGCRIGPEVFLESGCRIEAGTTVRRSVVLRGAVADAGAVVEDAVLG